MEGKNVANKRFMPEKNAIVLKGDIFDADNKQMSITSDPASNMDAVSKRYVDKHFFRATIERNGNYFGNKKRFYRI